MSENVSLTNGNRPPKLPVSGKASQDSIVLNLMGLRAYEAVEGDYQQTIFMLEHIMNDGHTRGGPPFVTGNPVSPDVHVIGGVHLKGQRPGYRTRDGVVEAHGRDVERLRGGRRDGPTTPTDPTAPTPPSTPPSNPDGGLIFFGLLVVAAVAYYFFVYRKHHGEGDMLKGLR